LKNLKNPFVGFANPFFLSPSGENSPQKKTMLMISEIFQLTPRIVIELVDFVLSTSFDFDLLWTRLQNKLWS
jgi:hypothetical protein